MTARRVVVTGIGPVTPMGTGVKAFEESLWEGRSGIGPLTRVRLDDFPVTAAGEVEDFRPEEYLDRRRVRRVERFAQFGFAASRLALEDAGLGAGEPEAEPQRCAVVIASAYAGMERASNALQELHRGGWRTVSPEISISMMSSVAAALVALEFGYQGPIECPSTGCAASGHAISRGLDLIRDGTADLVLVGGCDAPLNPVALSTFAMARALSTRADDPSTACRPFDATRDGFVMSEGATVLVLEEAERARSRGARVYAELLGYGHTTDSHNLAAPRPDGLLAAEAMRRALRMSGRPPADVDYVNAHAAGTKLGDKAETAALRTVFGAALPPVSSTKSMHGHLMGGTAAVEAAATALALHRQTLPPTANYREVDPDCAVDVVPNAARMAPVGLALSNSFALGGVNCSVALAAA